MIQQLHRTNRPTLFLKLDIAKAFDTLRWDFLLEALEKVGFGVRWRDWVSMLLSSASSSVFLNGTTGRSFKHRRGVRQGNPLSPLLFILALEPLHLLLQLAEADARLTPIQNRTVKLRVSLYADDAALFVNPIKSDVDTVKEILDLFGEASGLKVNLAKSAVFPIKCNDIDLEEVLLSFPFEIKDFPCKY